MRWVTFDCFGTLVDWRSGFSAILTPLLGDKTPEAMRGYDRFERLLEAETPHRLYKDVLATGLLRAAEEVGVPLSELQVRRLPQQWGILPVFEDVDAMLTSLRAEGHRLAVLTNCDDDLFEQTHHDIAPARDLGISRIWLDRDETGEDPAAATVRVHSATQVCEAIAALQRIGR